MVCSAVQFELLSTALVAVAPFSLRLTQIYHQHPTGRHPLKILKCSRCRSLQWLLVLKITYCRHFAAFACHESTMCYIQNGLNIATLFNTRIFMIWKMLSLVQVQKKRRAIFQEHQSKPIPSFCNVQNRCQCPHVQVCLLTWAPRNIDWLGGWELGEVHLLLTVVGAELSHSPGMLLVHLLL